jgi:hypothetical protein
MAHCDKRKYRRTPLRSWANFAGSGEVRNAERGMRNEEGGNHSSQSAIRNLPPFPVSLVPGPFPPGPYPPTLQIAVERPPQPLYNPRPWEPAQTFSSVPGFRLIKM